MGRQDRPVVLVVEDEGIVRELVCMDLEDAGFDVMEAGSGDEAFVMLTDLPRERAVDLLFTDIRMPGKIDGWTLAEKARDILPNLSVVYASGYSSEPARAVPGSEFIRKPYRTEVLLDTIRKLGAE